jgi:elongator complex protein 3
MNDFGAGRDDRALAQAQGLWLEDWEDRVHGRDVGARGVGYNKTVTRLLVRGHGDELLRPFEHATAPDLEAAQRANEQAETRCVGLVLETRPDHIDEAEVVHLRSLGCTKVQIGYQAMSDEILARNKRGHDLAATRRAMQLLRYGGFKVLAHFMPNLLGATPESDISDYARIFDDPDFRPDELKIYPCSLIESAELMRFYESGEYVPYTHAQLLQVFEHVLAGTPRYCRLARVIRDISSGDIVAGNRMSNFREVAESALRARGVGLVEIRAREIRDGRFSHDDARLRTTGYATGIGDERFIEAVTPEDRLLGFCRLALPSGAGFIPETAHSALLREVHVYGGSLEFGARDEARAQHRGLGKRLIAEAAAQAKSAGFADLAVISAIGTRGYYRKLGFSDGALYQHLAL